MNLWLVLAGLLMIGAAIVHSLVGEKVVLLRLYRRAADRPEVGRRAYDDPTIRSAIRLAWHSLSMALLGYAALLLAAGFQRDAFGEAWALVGTLFVVILGTMAAMTLVIARGRHIGWMWYAAAAATVWLSIG